MCVYCPFLEFLLEGRVRLLCSIIEEERVKDDEERREGMKVDPVDRA